MLDYARQRAIEALSIPRRAILATSGPAGLQIGEFRCEAAGLDLYLLVPNTSDHLFNMEQDASVILWTDEWELKGKAQVISLNASDFELELLREPGAGWCELLRVEPCRMQVHRQGSWGILETIDLEAH